MGGGDIPPLIARTSKNCAHARIKSNTGRGFVKSRSKRRKESDQTVKSSPEGRSSGQARFLAVKNLDPGRKRSYVFDRSDHPLVEAAAEYSVVWGSRR